MALEPIVHVGSEGLVVPLVDVGPDHAEVRGEPTFEVEGRQRGEEEAPGEVAAGAEEHESIEHTSTLALRQYAHCKSQRGGET